MTTMQFHEINKLRVQGPLIVLDEKLCVVSLNLAFYQMFHLSPEKVTDQFLYDVDGGAWNIPHLRLLLEEVLINNSSLQDFRAEFQFLSIGKRVFMLNALCLDRDLIHPRLILLTMKGLALYDEKP